MKWIESIKEHLKTVHEDLDRDVTNLWKFTYDEYEITVYNRLDEEKLSINGQFVAIKKRKCALERFIPYQTLKTVLIDRKGNPVVLEVTLGGFIYLNCVAKVDSKIIFKDKVRIPFF